MDEFYESNPDLRAIEYPHTLMMERLKDEERRRLDLFITKSRLTDKRSALLQENKQRKEDLEDLDENLRIFIEVRLQSRSPSPLLTIFTECRANSKRISKVLNIKQERYSYIYIGLNESSNITQKSSSLALHPSSLLRGQAAYVFPPI